MSAGDPGLRRHITTRAATGLVIANVIGAGVFTEGFDLHRLMDRTIWDNERNLDAAAMPLPDLGVPPLGDDD